MKLYDLRTEYRENPIGLTDKAPRFSWKIESEEQNTIQTVYEINVTDEKGNVVWNSGKKASDQSVLISYEGEKLADDWQGNGSDYAYVDNFDVFRIQDENYLRGADVSFLPAVEDLDGKYFANGVQQDCLRILSNHGVNSITNMLFVHAGKSAHYTDSLATVYLNEAWGGLWIDEQ